MVTFCFFTVAVVSVTDDEFVSGFGRLIVCNGRSIHITRLETYSEKYFFFFLPILVLSCEKTHGSLLQFGNRGQGSDLKRPKVGSIFGRKKKDNKKVKSQG